MCLWLPKPLQTTFNPRKKFNNIYYRGPKQVGFIESLSEEDGMATWFFSFKNKNNNLQENDSKASEAQYNQINAYFSSHPLYT